jgi:hypothetical protein
MAYKLDHLSFRSEDKDNNALGELIKSIFPNDQISQNENVSNLPDILSAVAIEYLDYVWHLEDLDATQMARIEKLEDFHFKLAATLTGQQYSSVEFQMRAFDSIKYQYRAVSPPRPQPTIH